MFVPKKIERVIPNTERGVTISISEFETIRITTYSQLFSSLTKIQFFVLKATSFPAKSIFQYDVYISIVFALSVDKFLWN